MGGGAVTKRKARRLSFCDGRGRHKRREGVLLCACVSAPRRRVSTTEIYHTRRRNSSQSPYPATRPRTFPCPALPCIPILNHRIFGFRVHTLLVACTRCYFLEPPSTLQIYALMESICFICFTYSGRSIPTIVPRPMASYVGWETKKVLKKKKKAPQTRGQRGQKSVWGAGQWLK